MLNEEKNKRRRLDTNNKIDYISLASTIVDEPP